MVRACLRIPDLMGPCAVAIGIILALLIATQPPKSSVSDFKEFLHRPDQEVGRLRGARQHEDMAHQLGDILWPQKQFRPIGLSSSGE
jgi:hypothetical protein